MDKINYEEIYDHCKAICPEMQSVIEYVRNISSSNKEIKNTVDRLKGGDMPAVKRYIELYMKKALIIHWQRQSRADCLWTSCFQKPCLWQHSEP